MQSRDLETLYQHRFPREELERKSAIWKVLCENFFQRHVSRNSTVLDLACGYGEFINHIQAAEKLAVDLNPESREHLAADVHFQQLGALEIAGAFAARADVVFTSNFLEHLPDKAALEALLEQLATVLRPGGRFMVMGPNLRYLPGAYWDFYDHSLGLTHQSLAEVLQLKGFEIELCIDRFLPYTTKGALPTHPELVRWYLRFPWAWRFLGKQFFIVAANRGSREA